MAKKKGKGGKKCITFCALAILSAFMALPAFGAGNIGDATRFAIGVDGVWFNGPAVSYPRDFEAGGNAALSIVPGLDLTAAAYYLFDHSVFRTEVGANMQITAVENRDLSLGLGIIYRMASESELRPNEWAPAFSLAWRPFPQYRSLVVAAKSSYGLQSERPFTLVGLRVPFDLGGKR